MTDPVIEDVKADVSKLKTSEQTVVAWGKAHIAALVGFICLVIGLFAGYHLHK